MAPDDTHNGRLEFHEVYSLDLNNTDLVVLSACQTQLRDLSAGDELVGLCWPAFSRARASCLRVCYGSCCQGSNSDQVPGYLSAAALTTNTLRACPSRCNRPSTSSNGAPRSTSRYRW